MTNKSTLRWLSLAVIALMLPVPFSCQNQQGESNSNSLELASPGYQWTKQYEVAHMYPNIVSALDDNHVWVGGPIEYMSGVSRIHFFDGINWEIIFEGIGSIRCIEPITDNSVLAASFDYDSYDSRVIHFNGSSREESLIEDFTVSGLSALEDGKTWAVGCLNNTTKIDEDDQGAIYFYDGSGWSEQFKDEMKLFGVSAVDGEHIWACGERGIYFSDGSSWELVYEEQNDIQADYLQQFYEVAAHDADHVWAAGGKGVFFYDGEFWKMKYETEDQQSDLGYFNQPRDVSTIDGDTAWACGSYSCIRLDGQTKSLIPRVMPEDIPDLRMLDVCATPEGHAWLSAGREMTPGLYLFYFDGEAWRLASKTPEQSGFSSITACDAKNAWATSRNEVLFNDGKTWSVQYTDENAEMYFSDIYALNFDHVWALGHYRTGTPWEGNIQSTSYVFFYDGDSWTELIETDADLTSITATDIEHVWISTPPTPDSHKGATLSLLQGDALREIVVFDESYEGPSVKFAVLDENHIWATCKGKVYFFNGESSTLIFEPSDPSWQLQRTTREGDVITYQDIGLTGITASDPQHVWISGYARKEPNEQFDPALYENFIYVYHSGEWDKVYQKDSGGSWYGQFQGFSTGELIAAQDRNIFLFDGEFWLEQDPEMFASITDFYALDANHVWVVIGHCIYFGTR